MAKIHEIENWIDGVKEEIIDPDIEIIDPHHHLWHGPEDPPGVKESYRYLLEDLWSDTSSGHNIKKTVFIDAGEKTLKKISKPTSYLARKEGLEAHALSVEIRKIKT